MEINVEALKCPNCGAPLTVKPGEEFTFCLYCNSSIRINRRDETGEHEATHTEIPPELTNEIRQLILSGKKEEAVDVYQNNANVDKAEAEKIVESLVRGITIKIMLNRPLSLKGVLFSLLFLILSVIMGYVLISGTVSTTLAKVVAWALLIFSLLNFVSLWRAIITTIKFLTVKWTTATILKYVKIGEKKKLSFFKILIDVKGYDGQTFQTETNIMIKTENILKLQEGKTLDVKYRENEKNNVVASLKNL